MPRVYIVQEALEDRSGLRPPKDLSSLKKYGEVHVLLHKHDRGTDNPTRILGILKHRLAEFNDKEDYVLNIGSDPVSSMLAGMALASLGITQANFLRWEKRFGPDGSISRDGLYVPVKLIIT